MTTSISSASLCQTPFRMLTMSTLITSVYIAYLFLSTVCQSFLLFFIVFHSTKSLQLFRFLLAYTSISQLVHAYGIWFSQTTFSITGENVEVRNYGLCRYLTGATCYCMYAFWEMTLMMASISISLTFHFKHLSVSSLFLSKSRLITSSSVFHVPLLLYIVPQLWTFYQIYQAPYFVHYHENSEDKDSEYLVIAEFSLSSLAVVMTVPLMYCAVLLPAPFCWYKRKCIIRELNRTTDRVSVSKRADHTRFAKGLFLQAIIPSLTIPLTLLIPLIRKSYDNDIRVQQLNAISYGFLSSFMDPLITLYSVAPYRNKIIAYVRDTKSTVPSISVNFT